MTNKFSFPPIQKLCFKEYHVLNAEQQDIFDFVPGVENTVRLSINTLHNYN